MIMCKTLFLCVRHTESQKNLRDVTGGNGEPLTENGICQAHQLGVTIKKMVEGTSYEVIASDFDQTLGTASIIAETLGANVFVSEMLKPAVMGIVNGLTKCQIDHLYPEYAERLKKWRSQEIEACELEIPGMERPQQFWDRIVAYMKELCDGKTKIMVCTRSVLVLLYNLAHGHTPDPGGGYKHVEINNGEIIAFYSDISLRNVEIVPTFSSESLI